MAIALLTISILAWVVPILLALDLDDQPRPARRKARRPPRD